MFTVADSPGPVPPPSQLLSALASAVDAVQLTDGAALCPDDRRTLLAGLWSQVDRLQVEVAMLARTAGLNGDWTEVGATSAISWLSLLTNSSGSTAKERLRVGAALHRLPAVACAARVGELSWDVVKVLATTDTPDVRALAQRDEAVLLAQARRLRLRELTEAVRHWKRLAEAEASGGRPPDPADKRSFRIGRSSDGWLVGSVVFDPEAADALVRALEEVAGPRRGDDKRSAAQRRGDALFELCDALLKGKLRGGRGGPVVLWQPPAPPSTSGSGEPSPAGASPSSTDASTSADDQPVEPADASCGADSPDRSPAGGTRRPAHAAWTETGFIVDERWLERLACSSPFARILLDAEGRPLDVGREERFATAAIWQALVARDGGCSHPWCDRPPGWCEAHHVTGVWEDERTITAVEHMTLACSRHHHLAHEGGWRVDIVDGRPVWTDPHGESPRPPPGSR